jgi:hypothetical protein
MLASLLSQQAYSQQAPSFCLEDTKETIETSQQARTTCQNICQNTYNINAGMISPDSEWPSAYRANEPERNLMP